MKNLPNIISFFRLLLIPVVIICFINRENYAALAVFAIAGLSDILDGYIARKYNAITELGKIIDPLADKGMIVAVLYMMTAQGMLHIWLPILITLKELVMFFGSLILYRKKVVISARWFGKAATAVITACVVTILLFDAHIAPTWKTAIQAAAVIFALFAFVKYIEQYYKHKKSGGVLNEQAN